MGVVETGGGQDDLDPAVIISLFPTSDAQALRQTEVGADLAQGYDGRLTINGVEIPEEQMDGPRPVARWIPPTWPRTACDPTTATTCSSSRGPARWSRSSSRAP